jgi:hypothetical protein
MDHMQNNHGMRIRATCRARPSHLRLIRPDAATQPRAKAFWTVSTITCPSRFSWFAKRDATDVGPIDHEARPRGRQEEEGTIMKTKESLISNISRFVFGLGIGLALTSAYVIVTSTPELLTGKPVAADIVRLDPVTVTISSKAFDEIHAEADVPTKRAHVFGAGALQV